MRPPKRTPPLKRAFVAAPLIGTILFLAAVLFTVNLSKVEAAQSARVVNDAYHNRIVSLIEIYRTDLNSVFRESLRRNIETFILRPAWLNFGITNVRNARLLSYEEVRKTRCDQINQVARELVCSVGGNAPQNFQTADSLKAFGYGIPGWVDVANRPFSFEGVTFKPANPQQMKLLNPDTNDLTQLLNYQRACQEFVQGSLFDCDNFARKSGPQALQCKDPDTGQVIAGCEEGTFYLKITPAPSTPEGAKLYAALPRIVGDDDFGNQVRSGAIGDENFLLPINIRVFRYDDEALEFYKHMAFGQNGIAYDREQSKGGLSDGLCVGGRTPEECLSEGIQNAYGTAMSPGRQDQAKQRVFNDLYTGAFTAAKTTLPRPGVSDGMTFYILSPGTTAPEECDDRCKEVYGEATQDAIKAVLEPQTGQNPTNHNVYAYFDDESLNFYVIDEKAAYRVRGTKPNQVAYPMTFNHIKT
ncbi:hypothetical protein HY572_02235 [Candidatus Micrarchaeota archaeon]|nr:hypothetical protein [Candidatus Micrarchaeota archaeon]